jgi:hypothetical protein
MFLYLKLKCRLLKNSVENSVVECFVNKLLQKGSFQNISYDF